MNEKEVSIRFNNEIKNQNKLKEYVEQLKTIKAFASALDKQTIADVNVAAANIKNVGSKMNTAFNLLGAREFTRAMQRLVKTMGDFVSKSSDYLENINLFQVAFDGNYKSADRFIKKMSEMYGMDESWLTRTVGIFRQLSNAMNLSAENGERLSTLMTQMSLDISSLYNIDVEKASSTLQSALAGQTKPIRGATGADITQATLQTTLDNLGIDRAVNQLSYAEKRLLIIISLTQQLNESIGDMGRTIESPANQTRVLKEQWERLSRAIGNVFLPIIAKVLPYLNAILMALTEIINLIASLFGFKLEDYDYFAGTADSVLDLEDALGGATSNANSLKKALAGLRGFDKLNVIRTPNEGTGGGGAGGGIGSGISGDILKAFNDAYDEYQKKLENVRMKAQDIKEQILETLGFHKELNYETGEWEWKYDGLSATIKGLKKWFKELNPVAKGFVVIMTTLVGSKIISGLGKLVTILGKTKLGKVITALLTPTKLLGKYLTENVLAGFKGLSKLSFSEVVNTWSGTLTVVQKLTGALGGLISVFVGSRGVKAAFKDATEAGWDFFNTFEGIAGALTSIFGGAIGGGAVGGIPGMIIGGVVGAIEASTNALFGFWQALDDDEKRIKELSKETQKLYDEWMEAEKRRKQIVYESDEEIKYYQSLYEELKGIVDENGNVKQGYEDRAKVITDQLASALGIEIDLVDNQIKGYETLEQKVQNVIDKKRAMAYLESLQEKYNLAIKNRNQYEQDYAEAMEKTKTESKKYADAIAEVADKYNLTEEAVKDLMNGHADWVETLQDVTDAKLIKEKLKKYKDSVDDARKAQNQMKETLEDATNTIYLYGKAYTYVQEENYAALNTFMEYEAETMGKSETETKKYLERKVAANKKALEDLNKNQQNMDKEAYEGQKAYYENLISLTNDKLTVLKMTSIKKTDELTDEMVDKWIEMGNKSVDEFTTQISKLPKKVQSEVVDKMQEKGKGISNELQKGMNQVKLNTTVSVDADTSQAKSKLSSLFGANSTLGNILSKIGISVPYHFAQGGLPPVGQLFVANERGAELVGNIGGQSFVANQNQMMELLDKKIGNAQSSGTQVYNIYLDENHKLGTYTLEQLQGMAKTNGKPITIS